MPADRRGQGSLTKPRTNQKPGASAGPELPSPKILGRGRSISADVADLVKIIDASGLDYRLTAAGTILEGTWDELMAVAKKCHSEMRKKTERIITYMKVDDYAERTGRLTGAVESVEKKLGKSVKK